MMMCKALYLLDQESFDLIYGPDERRDVARLVDIFAPIQTKNMVAADSSILSEVEIIMSGWGMPKMDEAFLAATPKLKAVFYASGSIKSFVTEAFWQSGISICSAWAANAVPVAEYTLSQVLFGLKQCNYYMRQSRAMRKHPPVSGIIGAYGGVVGIISLGMIGRLVCQHLKRFDVKVIAYDPFVSSERARELGVELCELEDIFRRADVVSLHTPDLPETRGMIRGEHLRMMKPRSTFINTARGAVIRQDEMFALLAERPDLTAVLDVTTPEVPPKDSPVWTLENVVLTPHIAGSQGQECRRMARYMIEELGRYLEGQPLRWAVTKEMAEKMA
jgi:phosphoglycerate dehydrogenase-like enzyme